MLDANTHAMPLELTLGVEIECLQLHNTYPEHPRHVDTDPALGRKRVLEALQKPLTATCAQCWKSHQFSFSEHVNSLFEYNERPAIDPSYTKWSVNDDKSVKLTLEEVSRFHASLSYVEVADVEIVSRVLSMSQNMLTTRDGDSSHVHELTYAEEINAVLQQLHRAFASPNDRLVVNPKCGLHVHIGNGHKGFPVLTVRNLIKLLLAFERQLDHLHSSSRIDGSTLSVANPSGVSNFNSHAINVSVHNSPLSVIMSRGAFAQRHGGVEYVREYRYNSNSNQYPERRFKEVPGLEEACKNFDIPSWLAIIDGAETIRDIQSIFDYGSHSLTVDLFNLEEYHPNGIEPDEYGNIEKMTIEFRQHAGTLDSEEINAWIAVLISLVNYAYDTDAARVQELCIAEWDNPEFDIDDLLEEIGCPQNTRDHYKRVMSLDPPGDGRNVQKLTSASMQDSLSSLTTFMAKTTTEARKPSAVQSVIRQKLTTGGYGQFTKRFLDGFHLPSHVKERLTIGWRSQEDGDEGSDQSEPSEDSAYWSDGEDKDPLLEKESHVEDWT